MPEASESTGERFIEASLALLWATSLVACYAGAPLTWDGASLLFAFLDVQDFSLPHERFAVALFQWPALLASRHLSNGRVLEVVYGLPYAMVPAASAWASWRLARTQDARLAVWPLLSLSVGTLVGQLFFVTESIIALHAVWPILLVVATGFSARRWLLCAALTVFLFGLHPTAGPLLLFAGLLSIAVSLRAPLRRRELVLSALAFLSVGAWRLLLTSRTPYEAAQLHVDLGALFRSLHVPMLTRFAAPLIPTAVLVAHHGPPGFRRPAYGVALTALVATGVTLSRWALDPQGWQDGLNFRFLAPLAAAPFLLGFGAAVLCRRQRGAGDGRADGLVVLCAALVFTSVLGVQCWTWFDLRRSLTRAMTESPACVDLRTLRFARHTALKWWTTPSYALLIQGRRPPKAVLNGHDCARRDLARALQVNPWYLRQRAGPGWFDLRGTGLPPPAAEGTPAARTDAR